MNRDGLAGPEAADDDADFFGAVWEWRADGQFIANDLVEGATPGTKLREVWPAGVEVGASSLGVWIAQQNNVTFRTEAGRLTLRGKNVSGRMRYGLVRRG